MLKKIVILLLYCSNIFALDSENINDANKNNPKISAKTKVAIGCVVIVGVAGAYFVGPTVIPAVK